ncbi:MAG: glycine oxidase ThiO [Oscillatoriales cyanobacterium SM2_2_1]|nr:glycine oxidase ThiO [Oscillatoriales cyanobacterium SM2_2_1]
MSDVVVVGGGIIGLAIALELQDRGATVTVLERGRCGQQSSWAAAGMLAPEAEELTGDLRELGLRSRALYPQWIADLQHRTGLSCGYWCCGILCPSAQPRADTAGGVSWLNRESLDRQQPGLGPIVTGARWLPEEGQVDNRRLMAALHLAVRLAGVRVLEGVAGYQWQFSPSSTIRAIATSIGELEADHYVLATGAWTRSLLPQIPVTPRKGQMLSVFDAQRSLQRVVFGDGTYLVPRQDGTIVIGATVEDVGFLPDTTATGIHGLLAGAIALYPAIATMPIRETWWGFRPFAPNEALFLGPGPYANLTMATGHYRNGILLAPVTAQIIADQLTGRNPKSHPQAGP